MKYLVKVRVNDVERTREWREIEAETLDAAVKIAEQMPDVEVCLDARIPEPNSYMKMTDPGQVELFTGDLQAMGGLGPQEGEGT